MRITLVRHHMWGRLKRPSFSGFLLSRVYWDLLQSIRVRSDVSMYHLKFICGYQHRKRLGKMGSPLSTWIWSRFLLHHSLPILDHRLKLFLSMILGSVSPNRPERWVYSSYIRLVPQVAAVARSDYHQFRHHLSLRQRVTCSKAKDLCRWCFDSVETANLGDTFSNQADQISFAHKFASAMRGDRSM